MRTPSNEWTRKFDAWQQAADKLTQRAQAIQQRQHEKGWKLAASVGLPRNLCCIHNASIDTNLNGWCKGNPQRLEVAKQALRYLDDFRASNVARRLNQQSLNQLCSQT